jgi:hypothetical protein
MKQLLILLALACAAFGADAKATAKKAAPAKPQTRVVQPLTIPPDAVANSDGSYSWTDKAGKKWIFNKTPFGISKMEDMGPAPVSPSGDPLLTVTDNGDTVRFERKSPFGNTKWEKKKTELNEDERRALEQQQAAKADPAAK